MREGDAFILAVICCLIGILIGAWVESSNWSTDIDRIKNEAVSKGCAEYFVDSHYVQQWRFKP